VTVTATDDVAPPKEAPTLVTPTLTPTTRPSASTVAVWVLLEAQVVAGSAVTSLFVPSASVATAVSCVELPLLTNAGFGATDSVDVVEASAVAAAMLVDEVDEQAARIAHDITSAPREARELMRRT
jgi:hypothetical protein